MEDVLKLARIQVGIIVVFVIFKFIRPTILQSGAPNWVKTFLLSFPNFCEGVIGVLILTGLGLYTQKYTKLKNSLIFIMAAVFTAAYTITQEVKIHNLGGNNIYDPNDVIYSVVGVLTGTLIVFWLKPERRPS